MKIIVTGGASFIGSHLVDKRVERGDGVIIICDMSSGSSKNIRPEIRGHSSILVRDLRHITLSDLVTIMRGSDIVYHLAADHGGRGYVELQQLACSNNFVIDNNVLQATVNAAVPRLIFASSGCIYPMFMQNDITKEMFLREEHASLIPWSGIAGTEWVHEYLEPADLWGLIQPDGLYGLAKITMEMALVHASKEKGLNSVSCRFFTVYGPRAKENHAIISFIARTFIKADPFTVWGDGSQIRNWTYVDDIVDGMILAADLNDLQIGYHSINVGNMEKITVHEAIGYVLARANNEYGYEYYPTLVHELDKPIGPLNRVADNSKLIQYGGKNPIPFAKGVIDTLDWYFTHKKVDEIRENLERLLVARS